MAGALKLLNGMPDLTVALAQLSKSLNLSQPAATAAIIDQAAIGDAGGQEAQADLGRHDDDRDGRAIQAVGQRFDLGDQVVVCVGLRDREPV